MHIKKIKIENFRNYETQEIKFNENVNVFYGDNASRKDQYFRGSVFM